MRASVGDTLVVRGTHTGDADHTGEILAVAPHGAPPYTVRWDDDGHEGLVFPGSDATVRPGHRRRSGTPAR